MAHVFFSGRLKDREIVRAERGIVKGYFEFVEERRADLVRIARQTDGEFTADDLASEAWLVATEIGEKRSKPIDFSDAEDQQSVLAWLFTKLVKFADKVVRRGLRVDHTWQEDDEGPTLLDRLAAPDSSDPQFEVADQDEELVAKTKGSFSQASFYAALMVQAGWHVRQVADLVRVTARGLRGRLKRLASVAGIQPSLFDGLECVPANFAPKPGPWRPPPRRFEPDPRQLWLWAEATLVRLATRPATSSTFSE